MTGAAIPSAGVLFASLKQRRPVSDGPRHSFHLRYLEWHRTPVLLCHAMQASSMRPQWQINAEERRRHRRMTDPAYRERIASQQRAAEERRRDRRKAEPDYREAYLATRRQQADRRHERLRADPEALAEYRGRKLGQRDPEKLRANRARQEARRRERAAVDAEYAARRQEQRRSSELRRLQRAREDAEYRQRLRERARETYRRNAERIRAERRIRADQRREELRAQRRRKYAEDPAKRLAYYRGWTERNLERVRAYQKATDHRRCSAPGRFTAAEWRALVASHGPCCTYCGTDTSLTPDHRLPICRGGSNTIENIVPACLRCNQRKGRLTEEEFRARLAYEAAALSQAS